MNVSDQLLLVIDQVVWLMEHHGNGLKQAEHDNQWM